MTLYLSFKLRFWKCGFVSLIICVMRPSIVNQTQLNWISIKFNQTQVNSMQFDWIYMTLYLSFHLRFWNCGFVSLRIICVMTPSIVNWTWLNWISIELDRTQSNSVYGVDWVWMSLSIKQTWTRKKNIGQSN